METNKSIAPHDIIFSLDIGTRSVVGILGRLEGDTYKIIDHEEVEHPERAMYDGQVHDIDKVSQTIAKVKEILEERNKLELKYVAIAAAGRTLKTHQIFIENTIDPTQEITKSLINSIEVEGTQLAQKGIEELEGKTDVKYYCVGYSVINYYLDGNIIGNLKGHRGKSIGAEILATFLPHVVVDSLYTVVHKVGLEVINLTLEPIACINIAIPPKFRLLNLVLIDIGAGTSDIAITKEGVISAYSMVDVAGDEITEALSKAYLMDFIAAENLKIQLNQKENHKFTNVVGIPYEQTTEEIIQNIQESISILAEKIADKVLEYNGKSPSAVFCVGGGSQIPGLIPSLANALNIPSERIVIRGTDSLENVEYIVDKLKGPKYVTPIGIGYTAIKERDQDFLHVSINGKEIGLFNSKKLTISDALILTGYSPRKLLPQRGKNLSYSLNGKKVLVNGDYGEAAKIYVNGLVCNMETELRNKDRIEIVPAIEGKPANISINEIMDSYTKIRVNNKDINLVIDCTVNGKNVNLDYHINDGDEVLIEYISDTDQLLRRLNINYNQYDIILNGKRINSKAPIKSGDVIVYKNKIEEISNDQFINVKVNGEDIKISKNKEKPPIFVDVFNYVDFNLSEAKGLVGLKLNGERANYTDELKENDIIEIYWH